MLFENIKPIYLFTSMLLLLSGENPVYAMAKAKITPIITLIPSSQIHYSELSERIKSILDLENKKQYREVMTEIFQTQRWLENVSQWTAPHKLEIFFKVCMIG